MGKLLTIINALHTKTSREYLPRMNDDKVACMLKAKAYGYDYWDGERRFGYGGYTYDGRWAVVAQKLIETYNLKEDASILDIGCGKGFLMYELKKLLPKCRIVGFDSSSYALLHAKEEIKEHIYQYDAARTLGYSQNEFDLCYSINVLHNLPLYDLKHALQEMSRVGKNCFFTTESYRNEQELFNLQCWALTCESFFSPKEWEWIFQEFGYKGDYEFIYFE